MKFINAFLFFTISIFVLSSCTSDNATDGYDSEYIIENNSNLEAQFQIGPEFR